MKVKPILLMKFQDALNFFEHTDYINVFANNALLPYSANACWWKNQGAYNGYTIVGYEYNKKYDKWNIYVEK